MMKKVSLILLLAPALALASNNPPTPDLLAAMQQQILAMQQQMLSMQNEQRQREEAFLKEIAALRASHIPSRSSAQSELEEKKNSEGIPMPAASKPTLNVEQDEEPSSNPHPSESFAIGVPVVSQAPKPKAPQSVEKKEPEIQLDQAGANAALFEAIDGGDIDSCRRLFDVHKANVNARDQRASGLDPISNDEGLTSLMKASAAGSKALIALCLEKDADYLATTNLCPWMAKEEARVRLKEIHDCIDNLKEPSDAPTPYCHMRFHIPECTLRSMLGTLAICKDQHFPLFTRELDALTLATVGGHEEAVDLLLEAMLEKCKQEGVRPELILGRIKVAIVTLIKISKIVKTNLVDEFFVAMGIPEKPKYHNYSSIMIKLLKAHQAMDPDEILLQTLCADRDLERARDYDHYSKISRYSTTNLGNMYVYALELGSLEILQPIAELLARIPVVGNQGVLSGFYKQTYDGEKLALLLAIDAIPESRVYLDSRPILQDLEWVPATYPIFIERMQNFIREQHMLSKAMDHLSANHLLPVLSRVVGEYAERYPLPRQEFIERIMPLCAGKKLLVDQLQLLTRAAKKEAGAIVQSQAQQAFDIVRTQPFTIDVLSLAAEQLATMRPTDLSPFISDLVARNRARITLEIARQRELLAQYQ